ncbi:MAG: arginine--tRNA ligase [Chitinophagaceae bacterium]|nr:arginine--tRNA ligase [Chitinophagaceae bacterium]
MLLTNRLKLAVANVLKNNYQFEINPDEILISDTKPEFEGDYTLVTFPFSKPLSKKPDDLGQEIGALLTEQNSWITSFNVIKGFLNLVIAEETFVHFLASSSAREIAQMEGRTEKIMIEYSSPNTNKPLHFGHLRNIFLGAAVSNLYKKCGFDVIKANLINDRGIHICKSMIAWMKFGNGATPQSTGVKGDHLVGDYYVLYNDTFKKEVEAMVTQGIEKEVAEKTAPILLEAQQLLRKWEAQDEETIKLWKQMNDWVYAGFDVSYQRLGVSFDKYYYESNTYLLGKSIIEQGLLSGVLFKKEDGSVWVDLTADGLDEKLLLRGDGTSVYITQDIGTADLKYQDFQMNQSVYVIGDEQNYHMQVLKLIMQKLHHPGADGIHHLSYGMVELPSGKMKSREGTVVDADDMMDEMKQMAQKNTEELGKIEGFTEDELQELYQTLGMGALKFYLLRVDPKKKMIFNPKESIDFHGFTGPFVQYTHARICSILRKAGAIPEAPTTYVHMTKAEKKLLQLTEQYEQVLWQASLEFNPANLCNYLFNIAQHYNSFLPNHPILKAEDEAIRNFRLHLSRLVKHILADGLLALGIKAPQRM